MTLIEQFDLENKLRYMTDMRDAWEREAEALRTAMHRWADRAWEAEQQLQHIHTSASVIQAHTRKADRMNVSLPVNDPPATLTPIHTLTPVKAQKDPQELMPSSCDPMEAKGARLALEQEEQVVVEKPFREVLRELHDMLIKAKEDSPKETGTWQERRVKEQARRIVEAAFEVVDENHSNRTSESGSRNACLIPHDTRPIPQQCCSRCAKN